PATWYASSTSRVWLTIGCGGATSSPGQPGTIPCLPRVLRSKNDSSLTMASTSPCTQSIAGLSSRSTMPEVLKCTGLIVLRTPLSPAANPGQAGDATELPG